MRSSRALVVGGAALLVIAVAAGGLWAVARHVRPGPTTALPLPRTSHSPPVPTAQTPTPVPLVSTLAPAPSPRINAAMVYDAARKDVVLFGGCSGGCNGSDYLGDTWTWDGARWTQRAPSNSPPARYQPAIAYDAAHSVVVMFGGANGDFSDTWTWDGTTWTEMHPMASPVPVRYGTTEMDYDQARKRVVLFSVGQLPLGSATSQTWTWNGSEWTQVNPPQSPTFSQGIAQAHYAFAMAYYPPLTSMLLAAFAPQSTTMWTFDGATWSQLAAGATSPYWSTNASMVYDQSHNVVTLYGGIPYSGALNYTWIWHGNSWSELTPIRSPPTDLWQTSSLAYDATHGVVMFFGGTVQACGMCNSNESNIVWTWDGTIWSNAG